jgi:hypothetical protein
LSEEQPEKEEERSPRSKVYIGLSELSSKQRGAVLGLVKDIGFAPEEIDEVVIKIPEEIEAGPALEKRQRKRK